MNGTLLETLVAEKEIQAECQTRTMRVLAPRLLEPEGLAELGSSLFREGTIVSFVAHTDTKLLDRLAGAIEGRDVEAIDEIGRELRTMEVRGLVGREMPAHASEHLVDIRYGSKALARGVAPSLVPVAVSESVWNGGELDRDKFAAVDYARDAEAAPPTVLVVLVKPQLSELEEAVVRAVPSDISEVHVKEPSLSWTPAARAGLHAPFGTDVGSPLFQKEVRHGTRQQVQQQQEDKQNQQQQQQQQQDDKQKQQQQQQQQDLNQGYQQQQQQQQDAGQGNQQQQQQQQDAQTQQDQQQNEQDAQTHQEQHHEGGQRSWVDDDRQGIWTGRFERGDYLNRLKASDFSELDATQSARALLALREVLLRQGMP
jgi:hypothetical protein